MLYTVLYSKLDELKKLYNKYAARAAAAGINSSFNVLSDPYMQKVSIYKNDHINHITYNSGDTYIQVIDIEIDLNYKIGAYDMAAIIDHSITKNVNAIYKCKNDIAIPEKYKTAAAFCDHCKLNRMRNKTALLVDAAGNIKQLGLDCLKDFTGVNSDDITKSFLAFNSILQDSMNFENSSNEPRYFQTIDYLAACIASIKKSGYTKSLKTEIYNTMCKNPDIEKDIATAEKVIDYFNGHEFSSEFLHNIKVHLLKAYTLENGFIAYAYAAYLQEIEKAEKEKAAAANTAYYGNIGDKITNVNIISGRCITNFINRVSYNKCVTTYLYELIDSNNNIFVWYSSKQIDKLTGVLSGTIKDHKQYNGQKQTVLTRCKIQ